jgi:ankyrin repeat protein
MDAAEMRHSDVVEYLLQVGADRKLVDRDGKSALDRAGNDKRVLAVFGEEQRR